jgi:hypothetical protein
MDSGQNLVSGQGSRLRRSDDLGGSRGDQGNDAGCAVRPFATCLANSAT